MKKGERSIIEKFFTYFPPFHAIPRANEALSFGGIELQSPILDLGCGDGKFSLLTFGEKGIDIGLDSSSKEIAKAEESGAYKKTVVARAHRMPFEKGKFATVVSNSVLEHVDNLDEVLKEISRVLGPKGLLIMTVPTPLVCRYQFWSKFIPGWADFKKRLWRHLNYFGEKEWQKHLGKAGFKLIRVERTNSKAAIMWADAFLPLFALGAFFCFARFLEKREVFGFDKEGATLLIMAQKR